MRMSIAAIPVSMSQYGTGQRFSSISVQPLSGSAYLAMYWLLLLRQTTRSGAFRPAEFGAFIRRPERVPVTGRLVGTLEREERPALAEPSRRRLLSIGEDPVDDLPRNGAILEA